MRGTLMVCKLLGRRMEDLLRIHSPRLTMEGHDLLDTSINYYLGEDQHNSEEQGYRIDL